MEQNQQTDEGFGSHSLRPWIAPLTISGVLLALALIGTYTFDWTWTGFKDNTLWDWLHLLIIPVALGIAAIWLTQHHRWKVGWTLSIWSLGLLLVLLEIATYAFDWKWTGFKGNKLWDWLNLMLLPLTMTLVTVWFAAPHRWRSWWTTLIWITAVVLAILALSSYLFHWKWTGFYGNTLWDWLGMLLVPVVLTSAAIWFTVPERRKRRSRSRTANKQKAAEQAPTDIPASAAEEAGQGKEEIENY